MRIIIARKKKGNKMKYADRTKLRQEIVNLDMILKYIIIKDITEYRNVIQAAARDHKCKRTKEKERERTVPKMDIKNFRSFLSRIQAWFKGQWKKDKKSQKDELDIQQKK